MEGFKCDNCGKWFEGKPKRHIESYSRHIIHTEPPALDMVVYDKERSKDFCQDCVAVLGMLLKRRISE